MSDRVTSISLPGTSGAHISDWGRLTPEEMIKQFREHARHNLAVASAILAASDDDFRVVTYLGPYAMHNLEVLQIGKGLKYGNKE